MIETARTLVRRFLPTDGTDLFEYLSLKETYEYEPGEPLDLDQAKRLAAQRADLDSFYAVVLKNTGKLIGHLYFEQTEPKRFLTWELGYIFNPPFQGQGFCTEASRALVEYGFDVLKAHRVEAYCNPKNTASCRVLQRIGLKQEGYFKEKAFFRSDENGHPVWHDCLAYGLIAKDYQETPLVGLHIH